MSVPAKEKIRIKAEEVVWREVGEELVVLELSTSTYLTLNGTAKLLWECLASGATLDTLVEILADRYLISAEQASADAKAFLASLSERNLLVYDE